MFTEIPFELDFLSLVTIPTGITFVWREREDVSYQKYMYLARREYFTY